VSRAVAAELFKLRTTRTSWGVALGSLALVLAISTIAALAGEFSADDETPGPDLLEISGLVQIFALVLGILIVATEFRHGTITPSLLAVPNRVRLILAKLIAALGAGALLRNQVGAIIGALGWIFLVEPLLTIIPGFDDVIAKWFPSGAANAAAGTASSEDALGQVPAGLLLAAYAAAFVAAGIVMVRRRDVSA
jgi:ABC-2 type transport system permease protein